MLDDKEICDTIRFDEAIPGLTISKICEQSSRGHPCYTSRSGQYCPERNVNLTSFNCFIIIPLQRP